MDPSGEKHRCSSLSSSDVCTMVCRRASLYSACVTLEIKQTQTRNLFSAGILSAHLPAPFHSRVPMTGSAATPPQLNALDSIFQGLRNKSHDVRLRAAEDLKQYVNPSSLSCFSRSAAQGLLRSQML